MKLYKHLYMKPLKIKILWSEINVLDRYQTRKKN